MRTLMIAAFGAFVWVSPMGQVAFGQGGQVQRPRRRREAPADNAAYFCQHRLPIDLERSRSQTSDQQASSRRRKPQHQRSHRQGERCPAGSRQSADVWVVTAGTATAVTGGQPVDSQKRPNSDDAAGASIQGGTEQPLKAGDVLYVPQGVPHGFKNVKDFRAFRSV